VDELTHACTHNYTKIDKKCHGKDIARISHEGERKGQRRELERDRNREREREG